MPIRSRKRVRVASALSSSSTRSEPGFTANRTIDIPSASSANISRRIKVWLTAGYRLVKYAMRITYKFQRYPSVGAATGPSKRRLHTRGQRSGQGAHAQRSPGVVSDQILALRTRYVENVSLPNQVSLWAMNYN